MIDEELDSNKDDAEAKRKEERDRILNTGYALTHVRVQKLNALAERLESIMAAEEAFWQKDLKTVKGNEVEVIKFSNAVIKEYRDTLGDIADELGGRSKRQETTTTETNTIPISILDAIERIYGDSTENQ